MTPPKNPKVLLLTNVISPYRIPVFNHLAKKTDILFVFLCEMLREWKLKVYLSKIKFAYVVLKGIQVFFRKKEFTLHLNRGFLRLLIKEKPDVIVSTGYTYIESILGLIYAKLKNKKFILWSGTTLNSSESKNLIVCKIKRAIITRCDSFLAYGSEAADYLIRYGADKDKIVISRNAIEVENFSVESKKYVVDKESLKERYNLPMLNILFCGRLVPCKNLLSLINAFSLLDCKQCGLIIIGDGYKKDEYFNYCSSNNIKNVFFKGHQDFEELVKYYLISDIFVLPSNREIWGLVVNEAMACGLPVICSNKAGAAKDLIKDGVNGYTFNPDDVNELKDKLATLLNDGDKRKKMGQNSLRIIKDCTPEKYAEDLLKAIDLANCNI